MVRMVLVYSAVFLVNSSSFFTHVALRSLYFLYCASWTLRRALLIKREISTCLLCSSARRISWTFATTLDVSVLSIWSYDTVAVCSATLRSWAIVLSVSASIKWTILLIFWFILIFVPFACYPAQPC
eukprot:XP_001708258.1 Hypothetical protein GL50803_31113 [Giardia lamblia ATCC 50803]